MRELGTEFITTGTLGKSHDRPGGASVIAAIPRNTKKTARFVFPRQAQSLPRILVAGGQLVNDTFSTPAADVLGEPRRPQHVGLAGAAPAMVVDAKSSVESPNAAAMKGREPFGLRSLIASM